MSKLYAMRVELREEGDPPGELRVYEGIMEEVGRDLPRLGLKGLAEKLKPDVAPLPPETS